MPLITLKKKEPSWISYIKGRIKKNRNFLGLISGPTGSGKSWAGLSICSRIDPTFGPDRIIMRMRDLMKLINSGKLKGVGRAILWDEASIDIDSKSWQSLTNKLVNSLLTTFRHQRIILLFTTPYMDFIDAATRKLFHAEFSTIGINYENKRTLLKPQRIQYNSRYKKFYYKYLRVKTPNGRRIRLERWNIPKPPNWLIEEYEQIKTNFTTQLNKDIGRQLDDIARKKGIERKPLTYIQKQVLTLMAKYDDVSKVGKDLGITERTVYFHISQARKKRYKIEEFGGEKRGRIQNTAAV